MKNLLRRGVVTLVFDDGYEEVYNNVLPILDRNGLPGVFAIPIDGTSLETQENQPVRPWKDWVSIRSRGHEVAAHSITHIDLTTLSATDLERELQDPVSKLKATTIVYPGGATNTTVIEAASKFYSAGRTVQRGFERINPENPMMLRTFNFTTSKYSVLRAALLAVIAWITNSWLIETYHLVSVEPSPSKYAISLKLFRSHVGFLKILPIQVKTISQVIHGS